MSPLEVVGMIAELLSIVGLAAGMPFLIAAVVLRWRDGRRQPVDVAVIDVLETERVAVWSLGGRTYSRPVTAAEEASDIVTATEATATEVTGYASPRDPRSLAFARRSPGERSCSALAATFLGVAVVGFLVSFAPMIW